MSTARVLLIEDDARLASMVADYLGEAGFRMVVAPTGESAMREVGADAFDAVILDLMLPDADGLDLCRRIRGKSDVPLLMLTARGDPLDRVIGLELGADDYLPKPFKPRELLARLRTDFRTACLSNSNELHWRKFDGFAGLFDIALSSHRLGVIKPDHAAFVRARKCAAAAHSR